jgi:hypothetical protein
MTSLSNVALESHATSLSRSAMRVEERAVPEITSVSPAICPADSLPMYREPPLG